MQKTRTLKDRAVTMNNPGDLVGGNQCKDVQCRQGLFITIWPRQVNNWIWRRGWAMPSPGDAWRRPYGRISQTQQRFIPILAECFVRFLYRNARMAERLITQAVNFPCPKNGAAYVLLLLALLAVSLTAAQAQFCPGYQSPGSCSSGSKGYGLGYISPYYSQSLSPYYANSLNPFYGSSIQPFVYNYCPQPPVIIDSYCPLYPSVQDNGDPYSPRTSANGRAAADRIRTLERSLVNDKDLPNIRRVSGTGDMTDVISQVFGKCDDTDSERSLYNNGLKFAGLKQFKQAIESFNKAIDLNPNSSRCYYQRGLALYQCGDLDKALESLNKAISLDPHCYHFLYSRGLVHLKLGHFDKAAADATKAISINNTYAPACYMLGTALSELKKYDDAASAFSKAIKADPKNTQAYFERGAASYNLDKLIPAIKDFNQVLVLNPNETSTHFMRGLAYFRLGQYYSAVDDYNRYLAAYPNQLEALINRGSAYYELDEWKKAIEDYNRALELDSKSIPCLYKRSICKLLMGNGQGAAEDAYLALTLSKPDEKQYPYLAILAYIGYTKANQSAEAHAVLSQALSSLNSSHWPVPVLQFFQHKLSEQQLLAIAAKDKLFLTQAHAYLGLFYSYCVAHSSSFNKQVKLAIAHLEWVRSKGENSLPEYGLAVAQLFRDKQKDTTNISRPIHDKWALVIGISKFNDSSISTLKYSDKDAKDFSSYLVSNAHFPPEHVKLLTNEEATRENILAHLGNKWLPRVTNPDDLVLVYFSTHGSPASMDKHGINYLVTRDTDTQCLQATGIPIQDLTRLIKKRVHADRVVVMLDACHSGSAEVEKDRNDTSLEAASNSSAVATTDLHKSSYEGLLTSAETGAVPTGQFSVKGSSSSSYETTSLTQNLLGNVNAEEVAKESEQLVICSSEPNQLSWESKRYSNSVFTHHLISGLKLKGQSTKLDDAYAYAREQVEQEVLQERNAQQTPVLKSKWKNSNLSLSAPIQNNSGFKPKTTP